MKKILFIFVALVTLQTTQCQIKSNIISKTDFYNIKINNRTLNEVKDTKGNESTVNNLFTYSILKKKILTQMANFYSYEYDGLRFGFSGILGTIENPILSSLKITNSNWSVTIKGKEIKVGDNISKLGTVIINNNINGYKSVIYQYCDGCNNYIYIDFDQIVQKITKIGFIERT